MTKEKLPAAQAKMKAKFYKPKRPRHQVKISQLLELFEAYATERGFIARIAREMKIPKTIVYGRIRAMRLPYAKNKRRSA